MMAPLDFFYYFGSTYTYLTVMRIEPLAAAAGVTVRFRPFNVRAIMIEMDNIPFRTKPIKARYMWRDIERRAARHGIPFTKVPTYPVDADLLANRVGIVAAEQGWCPAYTKASYRGWFLDDKPLGLVPNVVEVLRGLDKDPDQIMALAESGDARRKLDAETDVARSLGIFGAPTLVVDGELFWGDDRLEDALEWSIARKA